MFKKITSLVQKSGGMYFRSVRPTVLLIVIPACLIVPIYCYNIAIETFIQKYHQPAIDYELRFAPLRKDLPRFAVFNYVTDQSAIEDDFVQMRYTLVPARPINGLQPGQDYLVAQYLDTHTVPEFRGYILKRNYGNGVMLYKRVSQ
jgi:hypothetical protein